MLVAGRMFVAQLLVGWSCVSVGGMLGRFTFCVVLLNGNCLWSVGVCVLLCFVHVLTGLRLVGT